MLFARSVWLWIMQTKKPVIAWSSPAWRPDWRHGVLFGVPFLLSYLNPMWLYQAGFSIDPWVYFGFFTHLRQFKEGFFPGTYYGSRLAWIRPGYLANQWFSPVVARYGLHFAFF